MYRGSTMSGFNAYRHTLPVNTFGTCRDFSKCNLVFTDFVCTYYNVVLTMST